MARLTVTVAAAALALASSAPASAATVSVRALGQEHAVLYVTARSSTYRVDELVVMTRPPSGRCPRRPPAWAHVSPHPQGSAVRSALFGGNEAEIAVTPHGRHVGAGRTRLCAYALRDRRTIARTTRVVHVDPVIADDIKLVPWANTVLLFGWSVLGLAVVLGVVVWHRRRRGLRRGHRRTPRAPRVPKPAEVPAYGAAPDGYALGFSRDAGRPALVALAEGELVRHTLVLGATGSGKTVTLGVLVGEALHRGHGVVLIDLKGDTEFAARAADEAAAARRPFVFWGIEHGIAWNPLANGGPTELKDKLVGLEQWTEPHYKRAAERYLQAVFRTLQEAGEPATLRDVVRLMRHQALRVHLRQGPEELADEIGGYLDILDPSALSAIAGLANRLAVITESTAGPRFQPPAGPGLDLGQALAHGALVAFSLNSLRYGELAAQIGGLIIQDLKTIAGDRIERHTTTDADGELDALVVIDEFSALEGEHVLALLARARSARLGVVLATQELSDLERVAQGFSDQVLGNTAIKIVHRQDVPESAERLASTAGTVKTWQETFQTDYQLDNALNLLLHDGLSGRGTRKLVDEFRVHPNLFKNLPTGHAIVIRKTHGVHATETLIVPRASRSQRPSQAVSP